MMFLVIAIANTAIGTIQEIRSKRAVDKLTLVAEHPAKVIREGRRMEVRPSLLVRDDIMELAAGDPVSYTHLDVYKRQVYPVQVIHYHLKGIVQKEIVHIYNLFNPFPDRRVPNVLL